MRLLETVKLLKVLLVEGRSERHRSDHVSEYVGQLHQDVGRGEGLRSPVGRRRATGQKSPPAPSYRHQPTVSVGPVSRGWPGSASPRRVGPTETS